MQLISWDEGWQLIRHYEEWCLRKGQTKEKMVKRREVDETEEARGKVCPSHSRPGIELDLDAQVLLLE